MFCLPFEKNKNLITNSFLNFASRITYRHLLPRHMQGAGKFFWFKCRSGSSYQEKTNTLCNNIVKQQQKNVGQIKCYKGNKHFFLHKNAPSPSLISDIEGC